MSNDEINARNHNIKLLLATSAGQEFVLDVLDVCDIYSDITTGDVSMDYKVAGRRSVGLNILEWLEDADPSIYPNLLLAKQRNDKDGN
jgi:hypothetical protein